MRVSAKADYAIRAMAELAARGDGVVKAEEIAAAQDIPLKYLLAILRELKQDYLVRSHRGREGGYTLARPAAEISLADIYRAVEGPLANFHDASLTELRYEGPAAALNDVWKAVRTSLRNVLEQVSLAQLASSRLPAQVRRLAVAYETHPRSVQERRRL